MRDLSTIIGYREERSLPSRDPYLVEYANLKLAAIGAPYFGTRREFPFLDMADSLLGNYQEKDRLLATRYAPVDQRIQSFIDDYLSDLDLPQTPKLPHDTFILDRHGLARVTSVPPDKDKFESDIVSSYRVAQGVLHNPASDRRTTKGSFHVVEGGYPIPADKITVPKIAFARLLQVAMTPPDSIMELPFTSTQEEKARVWASLLLRPIVCPKVAPMTQEKRMEVRFFAPGNLVCNLDFVESIFGNAGDPYLSVNDSALDPLHWTGTTGCVILAPHMMGQKKKNLGLPHISEATEAQKKDGMCWESEDELYNDGNAFKITARDSRGVVVTLISDNYFGYCKKEVKTQISYSANLFGMAEEEHAGGALAYPSYDLGEDFHLAEIGAADDHTFEEQIKRYADLMDVQPEGYAIDRKYKDIFYVPEDSHFSLYEQTVSWTKSGKKESIRLRPEVAYLLPGGYRVEMVKPHEGRRWRLVGTAAEGTFCHKPSTVSGGGKSEISKSIMDSVLTGPVIVADFKKDFDRVEEILNKEYGQRFRDPALNKNEGRPLLSFKRSLGSVVKLLTPSNEYTDEFNAWLESIPFYIKELVFIVKRFYKEDWESNWRDRFRVDLVNGVGGNELKYRDYKLITQYLRLGFTEDGGWRTFVLRKDFAPAFKLQTEDDITASVTLPASALDGLCPDYDNPSQKFALNCEYRLFQRPDDAIIRGYDEKAEADMAQDGNFLSNYHPLTRPEAQALIEDTIRFDQFTEPMQDLYKRFLSEKRPEYMVSSAHPRIVDGAVTKNPRYLQDRDDLVEPRNHYLGSLGARLRRRIDLGKDVPEPVNAVLAGRRNNPPSDGVRPLAVHNPIHYLPLPELFMEFIASITGKSPSTTGAGSEGALTKAPFNCLPPIVDLNNALTSLVLTRHAVFLTAAGYVGPKFKVAHDVSLIVPEVWCRMHVDERDPEFLIENGYLERCEDFEHNGQTVLASRLGYRITERFVRYYFGRIFANPSVVFEEAMLKPELQDMDVFADSMDNIVTTHKRVAELYFQDGSIEQACPPLKAVLHIMAKGDYNGKTLQDEEVRALFYRDTIINSDWYKERLETQQRIKVKLWQRHEAYLQAFLQRDSHKDVVQQLGLEERLKVAKQNLQRVSSPEYLQSLQGSIGADPSLKRG